jgi:hypothetical protein
MEAVCSSETLVPSFQSARRHNPEDRHGRIENLFSSDDVAQVTNVISNVTSEMSLFL